MVASHVIVKYLIACFLFDLLVSGYQYLLSLRTAAAVQVCVSRYAARPTLSRTVFRRLAVLVCCHRL